jgi:hypothetical protein
MRTVLLCTVLALIADARAASVDLSGLTLAGSASLNGEVLRLTSAKPDLAGAAWLPERQPVGNGFETTFQFRLTEPGGLGRGADGLAFVLQNSGTSALGGQGSGGGFALQREGSAAIPQSIAVFFDTFRNEEIGDRSNNFVTVCTAGSSQDVRWPPPRLAASGKLAVNLKDRKVHTANITYQPPALTIYLDGKQVLATAVDLSTVIGADGGAWVGFTASTGAGYENHDILSWSLSRTDASSNMSTVSSNISFLKAPCLPDRNLCTPEHAVVEESGPGMYHVVMPGHLAWDASIPNPAGHPVVIVNARGNICRDVATLGAGGCAGPGALIQRTGGGRTSFWINVSAWFNAVADPSVNEGYFEFDALLK